MPNRKGYTPTVPPFKDDDHVLITITQEDGRTKSMMVAQHMIAILIEDGTKFTADGMDTAPPAPATVSAIPSAEEVKAMDKDAMLSWVKAHNNKIPDQIITMMEGQEEDALRAILESAFDFLRVAETDVDPLNPDPLPSEHDFDAMTKDQLIDWMVKHKGSRVEEGVLRTTLEAQSEDELRMLAHVLHA